MLVESHDRFATVGEFDPATGELRQMTRDDPRASSLLERSVGGHFSDLNGMLAVFYRHQDSLWLRLGEEAQPVQAGEAVVQWARKGPSASWLALVKDDAPIAEADYPAGPDSGPPLSEDPTPFIGEEDWDFGLFVVNVLKDPERARRIYRDGQG